MTDHRPVSLDPADEWDENDGYEYDDTRPINAESQEEADTIVRPDYVGVVSGAQYKLENADGVTEYALVIVKGASALLVEMADDDLICLKRQISGLLKR